MSNLTKLADLILNLGRFQINVTVELKEDTK